MAVILVINCGSSSLKFSCISFPGREVLLEGMAEKLGSSQAMFCFKAGKELPREMTLSSPNHEGAISQLFLQLEAMGLPAKLKAVGHRVVHGGEGLKASAIITPQVLAAIEYCSQFAPLHNPANLTGIRMISQIAPQLPQVAVFDTAFHHTLSAPAFLYAVPMEWYRNYGIRRYGFHGVSHQYVTQQAAKMLDITLSDSAFISAHLGNGASATAVLNGKSVDTTMGFTPLEGLVMGTRSGDIDPGLPPYLAQKLGITPDAVVDLLNKKSGLLGLSELSNDMRTLEIAAGEGHAGAALAIDVFVFRLARAIGALAMSLPKIDSLIFTGGIGENSAGIRQKTMAHLSILGFQIDEQANGAMVKGKSGIISSPGSTAALVVKTNEELMIARETMEVLGKDKG